MREFNDFLKLVSDVTKNDVFVTYGVKMLPSK